MSTGTRFTAAHEIGHLVLHRDAVGTDIIREREADQFAAECLTPKDSILPQLPRRLDLRRLAELSRTWGVSVQSLLYRCRETGLLSDSAASRGYQRLQTLREQPGFRPEPLAAFPHEQPIMLTKAFEVAAASGLTLEVLATKLGWTVARCQELLGIAPAHSVLLIHATERSRENCENRRTKRFPLGLALDISIRDSNLRSIGGRRG